MPNGIYKDDYNRLIVKKKYSYMTIWTIVYCILQLISIVLTICSMIPSLNDSLSDFEPSVIICSTLTFIALIFVIVTVYYKYQNKYHDPVVITIDKEGINIEDRVSLWEHIGEVKALWKRPKSGEVLLFDVVNKYGYRMDSLEMDDNYNREVFVNELKSYVRQYLCKEIVFKKRIGS